MTPSTRTQRTREAHPGARTAVAPGRLPGATTGPEPAAGMPSHALVFGPVRSRRLGWSLGVNNVPSKACTYACVYCQVGPTDRACLDRDTFFDPATIVAAVRERVAQCRDECQPIDYATFVPEGEPTLDRRLGEAIAGIAALGIRVAVLTNGSLLWRDDVRADLAAADWVSVKVDTVDEATWHRLNRPIGSLPFAAVLDGVRRFAEARGGRVVTETMLVAGLNDDEPALRRTAGFVADLGPVHAYISVPTRPPAESWVDPPTAEAIGRALGAFLARGIPASCLVDEIDEREPPIALQGDVTQELLAVLAVHPMTEAAAGASIRRAGADWSLVEALLDQGRIVRVRHRGRVYLRPGR